ncbi:MAG: hypothetical protein ACW9W4_10505 [Candidatus Nitrosopumilus sp. bin_7KS]
MKFTDILKEIVGIILGGLALFFTLWFHQETKVDRLSERLHSLLELLPNCGFSEDEFVRIKETLLQSQAKLHIEENYSEAAGLINSIGVELLNCNPKMEIPEPLLIPLTLLPLLIITCIVTIIRKYRKSRDLKKS